MYRDLREMSLVCSWIDVMSMVPETDTLGICMMMQSAFISLVVDAPICAVHIHPHSYSFSLFLNNNLLPFNLYLSAYCAVCVWLKGQSESGGASMKHIHFSLILCPVLYPGS